MRFLLLLLLPSLAACTSRPAEPVAAAHAAEPAGEPDLLLTMLYMQRFLEKTALAADAGNWPLADLYAHEFEETAEMLEGVHKDGVDLGRLAAESFLPAHERLEDAIDARDRGAYDDDATEVVRACNVCHAAAGYGDVRIVVPTDFTRPFPSQDFTPASP